MEVDKSEIKILEQAIDEWVKAGLLTGDKAMQLKESIISKQT